MEYNLWVITRKLYNLRDIKTPPAPSASTSNPSARSYESTSRTYMTPTWFSHWPWFKPPSSLLCVTHTGAHLVIPPVPWPPSNYVTPRSQSLKCASSLFPHHSTVATPPELHMPSPNCSPLHASASTPQCARLCREQGILGPALSSLHSSLLAGETQDKGWGNNKCEGEESNKASREGGADICERSGDPSEKGAFQQRPNRCETDRGEGASLVEV